MSNQALLRGESIVRKRAHRPHRRSRRAGVCMPSPAGNRAKRDRRRCRRVGGGMVRSSVRVVACAGGEPLVPRETAEELDAPPQPPRRRGVGAHLPDPLHLLLREGEELHGRETCVAPHGVVELLGDAHGAVRRGGLAARREVDRPPAVVDPPRDGVNLILYLSVSDADAHRDPVPHQSAGLSVDPPRPFVIASVLRTSIRAPFPLHAGVHNAESMWTDFLIVFKYQHASQAHHSARPPQRCL
eukprot:gene1935-biopygen7346